MIGIEEFRRRCEEWNHSSWGNGNLIEYWKRGGLDLERILENRKRLEEKSFPICILGSVGKTTLSTVLASLISSVDNSYYITRVNDNWLPQLPIAVELALRNEYDFAIFECGVALKGDASLMAKVVPAKGIVYSQFEHVHLSQLANLEGVADEKLQFSLENPSARIVSHSKNKEHIERKAIKAEAYYGEKGTYSDYESFVHRITEEECEIHVTNKARGFFLKTREIGFHLGPTCAGALAAYERFICPFSQRFIELKQGKRARQRMDRFQHKGVTFFVDTANANVYSILNSLHSLIAMETLKRKNAVIGEIYGLGEYAEKIIEDLVDNICSLDLKSLSSLSFIGENYLRGQDRIRDHCQGNVRFYASNDEFLSSFRFSDYREEIVLLRGPTKRGRNLSNILKGYNGSSDETSLEALLIP